MSTLSSIAFMAVLAVLIGGLILLLSSTHARFAEECTAAGGTVDTVNRGFWCMKDGVYIVVDR